jgi:hypothetical protein
MSLSGANYTKDLKNWLLGRKDKEYTLEDSKTFKWLKFCSKNKGGKV